MSEKGIKKYIKHKAVREFLIRSAMLAALLFGVQLSIMLYFRHTKFFTSNLSIPPAFYFDFLSGLSKAKLVNSVLFIAVAFTIYIRRDLLKFKTYKRNVKETWIFSSAAALVLIGHYVFKYVIRQNLQEAMGYPMALSISKLIFNLAFVVLLAYAVYGHKFINDFCKRFWKVMLTFGAITIVYYFLIELFQRAWFLLSVFVSKIIYFLLSLTYQDAILRVEFGQAPTIGAANFIVGVSKDCSGIDSLLLFISLFIFLWVLNRNDIIKERMIALFLFGLVGTVAYNLLRVYLIMLVGIHYDPRFAIDVFHTNAGWIMFLAFFAVFWHFGSSWVYKK